MDTIEAVTTVYLPPDEVYAFLIDFPQYARYSEYLTGVVQHGDGDPGTEYAMQFAWWKLTYTARSRVTDVDPPNRIDWTVVKDIDAEGYWGVEAVPLPGDAPTDAEAASEVTFHVRYRSESVAERTLDLPPLVSLDRVVDRVVPVVQREARRIVRRVVADLEGRRRPVELRVDA